MNINDVSDNTIPALNPEIPDDWLNKIFDRQEHLHNKYKSIEHDSGIGLALLPKQAFSIDNQRCQYVIKDFAWRVTEELAEAAEALDHGNTIHFVEEVIDALHFYTEMFIVMGYTSQTIKLLRHDVIKDRPEAQHMFNIIKSIGLAMNTLKQKPWKQHHFPTDISLLELHLFTGYTTLILLLVEFGLTQGEIYQVYYKKSEVNKFRQRSNY